jgi:Na+/H+ antiporter NhaD/arsenite permease-like protein
MKTALLGAGLLVVGVVLVLVGVLPIADAIEVAQRVWPILLFVVAITVVTELAAEAELFRVIAERAARVGGGRTWVLWLLVVVLAVACTVFLSLDTTAVLLTPVVIILARHVGVPPIPFALTTVWLANTGSLLLPVSNLTNLLAQHELDGISPFEFAKLMAVPAAIAVLVPCLVIFAIYRRALLTRFTPDAEQPVADRVLFGASAVLVGALVPALVSGVPVWIPATVAACILGIFFAVRRRSVLRVGLIPWQIVILASGLFLVVESAHSLGLGAALASISGSGTTPIDLVRLAATGAGASNIANNLPAYLALEPVAGDPSRIVALLIGVNAGPLITPWASLATLLWHQRVTALGVEISWLRYALLGLIVAPLTVIAAVIGYAIFEV